jgi:hypothetical protein
MAADILFMDKYSINSMTYKLIVDVYEAGIASAI